MFARSPRRPAIPPSVQTATIPAPVGGLNTIAPGGEMPPTDCFLLYNMIAAEHGNRTRLGSREWAAGLFGTGDDYVRSILPFTGSANNGSLNRLFATTSGGIWDVTSSGFVAGNPYAASTAYVVGDAVTLGGQDYRCVTAGTSHAGGNPAAWVAGTEYSVWDMVTSNGQVYIVTNYLYIPSAGVITAPSGAGDYQDPVSSYQYTWLGAAGAVTNNRSLPPPWAALTAYTIGKRVIFDDAVMYCSQAGTSGATEPDDPGGFASVNDATVIWSPVVNANGVQGLIDVNEIADATAEWRYDPDNISPSPVHSFSITSGRAGHGVCHVHVTTAGHFLLYWDEENGLHIYTESTGLWAAVALGGGGTEISGVDPANLVFGSVFKGRVWMVEKDTANLWYLATGAVYGVATKFALSTKLKAGGPIRGIWSWTYDGGSGVDDSLVAVSAGGDVVIYQGTDPASALTFGIVGVWGVGDLPEGRELCTDYGGELLLLTRTGIIPLSKLVKGGSGTSVTDYATAKISNLFNAAMLSKATTAGWTMRLHPEENALMVTVPEAEGSATTQLMMSLATGGWSRYRDLPIYANAVFGGKMYFGTVDGAVCINDGYVDGRPLIDPTEYTPVQYSGIGAFFDLKNANQKQVQFIRPRFLGQSTAPSFEVAARYDFDLTELDPVSAGVGTGSLWDVAVWDTAVWGGDYSPSTAVRGAAGMGVNVAMAWRGAAVDRTILVKFEVGFTQGGAL